MSELDHLTMEQKATRARALLMDPMLVQALQDIEDQSLAKIKDSGPSESSIREIEYYKIRAVGDLREALKEHITNFRVASRN